MCGKTLKNPKPRAVAPLETPHPWKMLWQPLHGTLDPQAAKKRRVLYTVRKCQSQLIQMATRCFIKLEKMCHNHTKENKMLKRTEEKQVTQKATKYITEQMKICHIPSLT